MDTIDLINYDKKTSVKNFLKQKLFMFVLFISVIQQMPIIRELYYTEIRYILYLILGTMSLLSVFRVFVNNRSRFLLYFTIIIGYSSIVQILSLLLDSNFNVMAIFLVPYGIMITSMTVDYSEHNLSKLITRYSIIVAVLGIFSIFYYGEGFTVTRTYLIPSKNQIGPMIGIVSSIMLVRIFNTKHYKKKVYELLLSSIIMISTLSTMIVIRNRSGILSFLLVTFFLVASKSRFRVTIKRVVILLFCGMLLLLFIVTGNLTSITTIFWKSFTYNYELGSLESLSAGRTDTYMRALGFILDYPIAGNLGSLRDLHGTPHNYLLYTWTQIGFVLSLPFTLFYLFLFKYSSLGIFKRISEKPINPVYIMLMFMLIVSMFEYTYPYGPGVSQLLLWFLIGQSIKDKHLI